MLFRGPNYVGSVAFRVPGVPQDGLVDVWLMAFVDKLREVAGPLAVEAASGR